MRFKIGEASSLYTSDVAVNDGTLRVSDAGFVKVVGKGEVTNNGITLGNIQLVFNVDGTVDNSTEFSTTSFFMNYDIDNSVNILW